ncbi:MAG: DUF488 domain-containing protein [Candidatus Cloacimonetes bacterium]|nr:DUF488 domain-containing protein [Candidatus Cloacimonadota bacterium]
MYYRRRILLGIIEKSGGKFSRAELEKLLFLFCKMSGENYYDFFPCKSGCYSYISYQDFGKLVKDGYLQEDDRGKITIIKSEDWNKLKKTDQTTIYELIQKTRDSRLNDLISMIYEAYPYYASRSENLAEILGEEKAALLKSRYKVNNEPCLIGKGYEGITIDRYLSDLISESIQLVIDVRKNPVSMKYNFNKQSLSTKLAKAGISYINIPALGIPSEFRKKVNNDNDYPAVSVKLDNKITRWKFAIKYSMEVY